MKPKELKIFTDIINVLDYGLKKALFSKISQSVQFCPLFG